MAAIARGRRRHFDPWPGYVDVLSTLLMVVIFVLMVFVIAQVFLSRALSGSEDALAELRGDIAALQDMLALREGEKQRLSSELADLSATLNRIAGERDDLSDRLTVILGERDALAKGLADAQAQAAALDEETKAALAAKAREIEDAYKVIEADRAKIQALLGDIALLESLREEMAQKLLAGEAAAQQAEGALIEEKKLSESARLQLEILNRQLLELRDQIATLNAALEASEQKAREQEVQIADLGTRLNAALASKVAELAAYRSEFFGRLKEVLGERPDVRIVGDRFVFQSEVLFDVGSAEIAEAGKAQLAQFARTLIEISAEIPEDIDWILRVDGHTDPRPIATRQFRSNWELSAARAIAVVNFLQSQGVPPRRLVAAGFGEYRPLDETADEEAFRRNRRIELKLDQR
jgi:chemotaxis protein MotB